MQSWKLTLLHFGEHHYQNSFVGGEFRVLSSEMIDYKLLLCKEVTIIDLDGEGGEQY